MQTMLECVLCLTLPSLHIFEIFLLLVRVLFIIFFKNLFVTFAVDCVYGYVYSLPRNKMASNGESPDAHV